MKKALLFFFTFISFSAFSQYYSYSQTGELIEGRMGHTATLIPSLSGVITPTDAVLVAGGTDGFNVKANAEWQGQLVPMSSPRTDHTATETLGKILVAGGYDGVPSNVNTTEIFDPVLGEFEAGPNMTSGRSFHRSVKLYDGQVLITGGYDGTSNLSSCDIYDPVQNTITATGSLNFGRSSHTITLLPDGKVLVTGGFNPDFNFQMNQCEIYDPGTGQWTLTDALSNSRDNHAASVVTMVLNGNEHFGVAVSGGRYFNGALNYFEGMTSVEFWDIINQTWVDLAPLSAGQSYHEMFSVSTPFSSDFQTQFLIPGGMMNSGIGIEETYSPSTSSEGSLWYTVYEQPIPHQGRKRSASVLFENENADWVVQYGGLTAGGDLNEVGVFEAIWVGIEEQENAEILIYPQPSKGDVFIQLSSSEPAQIEIFDVLGQKVKNFNGLGLEKIHLETTGQYVVRVTTPSMSKSQSILITE